VSTPVKEVEPARAAHLWEQLSRHDEDGEKYLAGRGLTSAVELDFVRFNVGGTGSFELNARAQAGYRIAVPAYGTDGEMATLQLRSVRSGADPAKVSLKGGYPDGGVAMGAVKEARQAKRVYLGEGIADTLALRTISGATVIGAPGAETLGKLASFLGNVRGREVVLCPQNDDASGKPFAELARELRSRGATVLKLTTSAAYKDPAEWLQAIGPDAFGRTAPRAIAPDTEAEPEPQTAPAEGETTEEGARELDDACQKIEEAPKGQGSLTFDKQCFRIGTLVAGSELALKK